MSKVKKQNPTLLESAKLRVDCGDSWEELFIELAADVEKATGHYAFATICSRWKDIYKRYWKLYAEEMDWI